jgi:hypothetical protein
MLALSLASAAASVVAAATHEAHLRATPRHVQESVGRIVKFRLMDAAMDEAIADWDPLPLNARIDMAALPTSKLTIEAVTNGTVRSVQWEYNGVSRVEDKMVWSLCGNNGRNLQPCAWLGKQNVSIVATPYGGLDATGIRGRPVYLNVTFF